MSDHFYPETRPRARKPHRCIWCYAAIPAGEQYVQQEGFYDSAAQRNRYHNECWDVMCFENDEFMPGCGEPPERLRVQA